MKCAACENGDHDNCGMQTWCSCDCEGSDGYYFPDPDDTDLIEAKQHDIDDDEF